VLNGLKRLVTSPPDQSVQAALEIFAPDAGSARWKVEAVARRLIERGYTGKAVLHVS
jgi:hypothetical protein